MRTTLKDHGSLIAICLGLLALVVAGTGTAVAAAATVVNIADPSGTATRVAKVDTSGRLSVAPAVSTLAAQNYFTNAGNVNLSSPTSATLVLTSVRISETAQNAGIAGSDLTVRLVQNAVDASGSCTTNPFRYLTLTALGAGQDRVVIGDSPVQVKPSAGQTKYCLGVYSVVTNGATDATNYYPYVSWTGYVGAGSYTGIGTGAARPGVETGELPPKAPQP